MEIEKDMEAYSGNESVEAADEKPFHYSHSRANIAVDLVIFGVLPDKDELCVFVHRPKGEGVWWLPGRFMHCGKDLNDETANDGDNWTLEDTMRSALSRTWPMQKTVCGKAFDEIKIVYPIKPNLDFLCQLDARSALDRDQREDRNLRVVSIPYMTLISVRKSIPQDVVPYFARWMPVSDFVDIKKNYAPGKEKLAHDHFDILTNGIKRLFQEVRTRPIGGSKDVVDGVDVSRYLKKANKDFVDDYFMLPSEFDISSLINIYNVVLRTMGVSVERSNLRKLLQERGVIEEVNCQNTPKKGGATYKFVVEKYNEYKAYLSFGFNPKPKDLKV